MSVTFTRFGLGYFRAAPPTKLRRTAELLARKHGTSQERRDGVARAAAMAWLRHAREEGQGEHPSRQVARGLASLYVHPPERSVGELADEILEHIGEHLDAFEFRELWSLWQLGSPAMEVVAERFSSLVKERRRSPRLERRLPEWARDDALDFARPLPRIIRWITMSEMALVDLTPESVRLSLGSGLGAELILALIRQASRSWWSRQDPEAVRAWAAKRPIEVRAAVAERQLIELGRGATSLADLPRSDESTRLKTWVLGELGDPSVRPGSWREIDARALEVFEWMLLWDQLALIFSEFAKHAEDARAEFWRDYLPFVRDARYYQAYDTAVCMLAFEDVLVIEFGSTGNATYLYRRPQISLRKARLTEGRSAGHFKRADGLDYEGIRCKYLGKMSHMGAWQWAFRDRLAELGLVLGQGTRRRDIWS